MFDNFYKKGDTIRTLERTSTKGKSPEKKRGTLLWKNLH